MDKKVIHQIADATGKKTSEIEAEIAAFESEGISRSDYFENKVWNMSEDEASAFVKKKKIAAERKAAAEKVSKITGWSEDRAAKELAKARAAGLSARSYLDFAAWSLGEEEIPTLVAALKERKAKRARSDEWMVNVVCEKSGWSRDFALERMKEAALKGYTYRKFITEALYKLDEDQFSALEDFVKKPVTPNPDGVRKARDLRKQYEKTMKEEMGWTDGQLKLEYFKCKNNCGASFPEFYLFGLYRLAPEEQQRYITQEMHIKMQLRYCDYKGVQEIFENKSLFNEVFKDYVHRRWFVNKDLSFEAFEENIEGLHKIMFKPLNGIEGIGITSYIVNENTEQNKKVYEQIISGGDAIIEECVVQHEDISAMWPNSVNTIRMMSICDNGKGRVLNAVMKFGTKPDVDNYYQGGIAAGVDIETGRLCTHGVNNTGVLFEKHPHTGMTFKGFQIPNWDKLLSAIESASALVEAMPYVGWDVALSKDGEPEIIEGNHNQGAYLIQYSFAVSNAEGRRPTIDPYLWF